MIAARESDWDLAMKFTINLIFYLFFFVSIKTSHEVFEMNSFLEDQMNVNLCSEGIVSTGSSDNWRSQLNCEANDSASASLKLKPANFRWYH